MVADDVIKNETVSSTSVVEDEVLSLPSFNGVYLCFNLFHCLIIGRIMENGGK